MTKIELAQAIASQTYIEQADVLLIIDTLTEVIKSTVANNEDIFIRGFGTFKTKHCATRQARDIRRNQTIIIPAHKIPYLKISKEFAQLLKDKK